MKINFIDNVTYKIIEFINEFKNITNIVKYFIEINIWIENKLKFGYQRSVQLKYWWEVCFDIWLCDGRSS